MDNFSRFDFIRHNSKKSNSEVISIYEKVLDFTINYI
jgi:hypothetical protein